MKNKIEELTAAVQAIGKLLDEITTVLTKLALLVMALQTVIHILKVGG